MYCAGHRQEVLVPGYGLNDTTGEVGQAVQVKPSAAT
jgi:hypothetical protein